MGTAKFGGETSHSAEQSSLTLFSRYRRGNPSFKGRAAAGRIMAIV